MRWQVQEAKNRFSALVRAAEDEGPQIITVHGRERAVLLSAEAYRRLQGQAPGQDFVEFMRSSPWADTELELERDADLPRPVDL
jgi:prevent-host-death family protein